MARWLERFLLFQIACQLALLSSSIGPFRPMVRVASLGASLLLLVGVPGRGIAHPSTMAAGWAIAIVAVSVLRSLTGGLLAAVAQLGMYVAILAPLFWVGRLPIDSRTVRRVLLILWAFHSVSAAIGVLQVQFPGSFQPSMSYVIANEKLSLPGLQITTETGERVFRPMGLTDVPGGAATSGFYAVLLGLGFLISQRSLPLRVLAVAGMLLGCVALYLSQIRSVMVMLAVCILAITALFAWHGEKKRLIAMWAVLGAIVLASFAWAIALAGGDVSSRLATLIEGKPTEVYYENRGRFLQDTIEVMLPLFPLGAGPGRWGMINYYFGQESTSEETAPIWVEIQWTGWLLDGGVPLVLAYAIAIGVALFVAWRVAARRDPAGLWIWGAIILAYDVGALAITFNYPYFHGQGGLEFWLLNSMLFAAFTALRPVAVQYRQDP